MATETEDECSARTVRAEMAAAMARPAELLTNDPDPAEGKCGCPESLRLRAALARVMEVTGTSTLQYHIAREALE